MITQKTAATIWNAYREIEASNKLIEDMAKVAKEKNAGKDVPVLEDAFGREAHLELGVPCSNNGHRIFRVNPTLAVGIINAHISEQRALLVAANEEARNEID